MWVWKAQQGFPLSSPGVGGGTPCVLCARFGRGPEEEGRVQLIEICMKCLPNAACAVCSRASSPETCGGLRECFPSGEAGMQIGMLWLDSDRHADVALRIERAAQYYRAKYGRQPNLCLVHPRTAGDQPPRQVSGLEVRTSRSILPDHFWLGVEERNKAKLASVGQAA